MKSAEGYAELEPSPDASEERCMQVLRRNIEQKQALRKPNKQKQIEQT
jgi:hypothetical protein